MKLRIRGNSIRFRLTQSDVESIKSHGSVEESTEFATEFNFAYSIVVDENFHEIVASYINNKIIVSIPELISVNWLNSTDTGIYATHGKLEIAIEKDFKCLVPRSGDDDLDTFPHPKQ
jgi:hypothetical protein